MFLFQGCPRRWRWLVRSYILRLPGARLWDLQRQRGPEVPLQPEDLMLGFAGSHYLKSLP